MSRRRSGWQFRIFIKTGINLSKNMHRFDSTLTAIYSILPFIRNLPSVSWLCTRRQQLKCISPSANWYFFLMSINEISMHGPTIRVLRLPILVEVYRVPNPDFCYNLLTNYIEDEYAVESKPVPVIKGLRDRRKRHLQANVTPQYCVTAKRAKLRSFIWSHRLTL